MLDSYRQQLKRIRLAAESLEATLQDTGEEDLVVSARQLQARIRARPFTVALVGAFKAGKSTLTNCLIESELLPTSARECTAVVTRLTKGQSPQTTARLVFADGPDQACALDSLDSHLTVRADRPPTEAIVSLATDTWLPDGIELVDTPGLGAAGLEREDITLRYLPAADAIVFVTRADQMLTEHEQRFLRDALAPEERTRVFLVVNFADRIRTQSDKDEVMSRMAAALPEAVNAGHTYLLSAADGLEAFLDEDSEAMQESGVDAFRQGLFAYLQDERATDEVERLQKMLTNLTTLSEKRLVELKSLHTMDTAALNRRRERIGEMAELLKKDGPELRRRITDAVGILRNSSTAIARRHCGSLQQQLEQDPGNESRWRGICLCIQSDAQRELRTHFSTGAAHIKNDLEQALSHMMNAVELGLDETLQLPTADLAPSQDVLKSRTITESVWVDAPQDQNSSGDGSEVMSMAGAGIGAVVGSMVAGPFGAAIGAAIGAAMGHSETRSTVEKVVKRKQLDAGKTTQAVQAFLDERIVEVAQAIQSQFTNSINTALRSKLDDLHRRAEAVDETLRSDHALHSANIDASIHAIQAVRTA